MKKGIFFSSLILVCFSALVFWQYVHFFDHKLHIVFCDVGQGDGVVMRTPSGKVILWDGGPDEKILDCLGRYLPFWQRHIDLLVLSHPHADHLNGFIPILQRYSVSYFVEEDLVNHSEGFAALQEKIKEQKVKRKKVQGGDRIGFGDGIYLLILGPSEAYIHKTTPDGNIADKSEFASLVGLLSYEDFEVLFTGDSQVEGVQEALKNLSIFQNKQVVVDVLQTPHHGSKFGLSEDLVKKMNPTSSIISVGAKNKYRHPSPLVLSVYEKFHIPYFRTDKMGDIEIVSDGKSFQIK